MELNKSDNIILIGMPASGKSTVGVILAKVMGMGFVDTDLVIQNRENALLCDIQSRRGLSEFMRCEEEAVLSIRPERSVIATGGSVVYSDRAMQYLKSIGTIVYLKVDKQVLFRRLRNIKERGVVLKDGETLDMVYDSRSVLYEKYADVVVEEKDASVEMKVESIRRLLSNE